MNKKQIYTAGAMEIYAETNYAKEWRDKVKEYFKRHCEDVNVISPVDFFEYGKDYHNSDREVFNFDLRKVRESDVILVNLNDIRKSIGTCMELKEATTYAIPIIGFLTDEVSIEYTKQLVHPWVYCCCDRIETGMNSMESAMNYIKDYYC